jgi:hypothetical protein
MLQECDIPIGSPLTVCFRFISLDPDTGTRITPGVGKRCHTVQCSHRAQNLLTLQLAFRVINEPMAGGLQRAALQTEAAGNSVGREQIHV